MKPVDYGPQLNAPQSEGLGSGHDVEKSLPTIEHALSRLTLSRERLRESLTPAAPRANSEDKGGFHPLRRARAWLIGTPWGGFLDPVVTALSDEVSHWWHRQAWRHSVLVVKDTLSSELTPMVRRHPLTAVLVMAAAGAMVAASGVWRWRTVRRSTWQLGTRIRRALVGQLSKPAVLSVILGALVSTLASRRATPSAAKAPSSSPAAAEI